MNTTGIIVAAGESRRFHGKRNKQFAELGSRPVLQHSLAVFDRVNWIARIIIVGHPGTLDTFRDLVNRIELGTSVDVISGGESRFESVRIGLGESNDGTNTILVHDGARPGVDSELCDNLMEFYIKEDIVKGVIPVLKVNDTIKRINPGRSRVEETIDRDVLRRVQTPQLMHRSSLLEATNAWDRSEDPTDESMLLENAGFPVGTVRGAPRYRKITTPEDLSYLDTLLGSQSNG